MKKLIALANCIFSFSLVGFAQQAPVTQEWVQRFTGPNVSIFNPVGAVDVNGDVYITGATRVGFVNHVVTIKYNKAGVQQWVVTGVTGQGTAIVLDNASTVYVTGTTTVNGTFDFITIKYNSSGTEQWQSIYNGALNGFDAGAAIAIDNSGNVYATGTSEGGKFPTTIKYNSAGVQQWAAVYTVLNGSGGANAIALDASNNVYVTGSSDGDYATIKYNTNGTQQWVALFNGTGNSFDEAKALALDKNNDVYVTGLSTGDTTQSDAVTVKYNNNGLQQWDQLFNGSLNGNDFAVDIATDSQDNVIITGQQGAFSPQADMLTIQYNKNGVTQWIQTHDGASNQSDYATALALDNSDNIYITGASSGTGTSFDYATIRYSPDGQLKWAQFYNDSSNGIDQANAIAIDGTGNVYVTGLSEGTTGIDIATIKYSQPGFSCQSDIDLGSNDTCVNNITTGDSAMWFSFKASASTMQIVVQSAPFGTNSPYTERLTFFSGACSALQVIDEEALPQITGANELVIDASNLAIGNTYYIKVSRGTSSGMNFTLCIRKINFLLPKDFGLEPPAISHCYYANKGQIIDVNGNPRFDIKNYTNNASPAVYLTDTAVSFVFARIDTIPSTPDTLQRVDMVLTGANRQPPQRIFKTEKSSGYLNYFLGHVPTGVTNINGYCRTVQTNVYPNIDMQYYSNSEGVKFYFVRNPGGNPDDIELQFNGATAVNVTASGGLDMVTPLGKISFEAGHAYAINPAGNVVPMPWQAKFVQVNVNTVKFDIHQFPTFMPLIIQVDRGHTLPSNIQNLDWSTFYGGNGGDVFYDSKTDASSNLYLTGYTSNNNFPVFNAYIGQNAGSWDAVALKFDSQGQRLWATYFGGSNTEVGIGVAVDPSGNIFVTGWTISTDLPTSGGNPGGGAYYVATINNSAGTGYSDAFMFKLTPNGQNSFWRTYYGGGGNEYSNAIASDGSGNIFITGQTEANNFPVKNPGAGAYYQGALAGPYTLDRDAFIVKFSGSNLNNVWSTYYGGTNSGVSEEGKDITVDWQGNIYVTGRTPSSDFPKLNPGGSAYYDGTLGGTGDAFLLKFSNSGTCQLATYYGGSGYEVGNSVITDGGLGVFFTGSTSSIDFPTQSFGTGFFQGTIGSTSASDVFLVKLGSNLARQWATYYGGTGIDVGLDLDVDGTNGIISLTGNTQSNNLPLPSPNPPNSYNQSYAGSDDSYIASFDGFFLNNIWGTYLGGSGSDIGYSIVSDANSKLFVSGSTASSATFPLDNGGGIPYFQGVYGGAGSDGCITRFDIVPVVGINELLNISANDISIFPNPTGNLLYISFSNRENSSAKIVVYNTLGEMIHSVDLEKKSGDLSYVYSASNLNPGVYFLQIKTENGTANKMFIKR